MPQSFRVDTVTSRCEFLFVIVASCFLAASSNNVCLAADSDSVDFSRDIRPVLSASCFACHGPDAEAREAELRLDDEASATKLHDGEAAIVAGSREKSTVFQRLVTDDPDLIMPPPDSGHEMTAEQIELVGRWIDQGAKFDLHWSFRPLVQRPVPENGADWSDHPIDRFAHQAMTAHGLRPSNPADLHALIRRLSLDLIGLPPSPAEVDAFVADESPDAVSKLVDRLLESPRFGEHWARMWLDLARYADTKGYEKDNARNIWRYRDWVIDALNADMPYDRFTTEQLAGDLLPDATTDQILATAFHRNTMTNDEGGTDNEEFRMAAVKDRVNTTVQVWMGLTMGCANCHSHKYDPITQHEYYSFLDMFNQTEDADRPDDSPRLATPTAAQTRKLASLNEQLLELRKSYRQATQRNPEFAKARTEWEQQLAQKSQWTPLAFESATADSGAKLDAQSDGSLLVSGKLPERDVYSLTSAASARKVTAIRIEALTDDSLGRKPGTKQGGPGRNGADPNFVISELIVEVLRDGQPPQKIELKNARADFSQNGWPVTAAIDGKTETGWAVSPQFGRPHVAVFELSEPLTVSDKEKLQFRISQQYGNKLVLGRFRVSMSAADPTTLAAEVTLLNELAAKAPADRSEAETQRLIDAFAEQWPETQKLAQQIAAVDAEKAALQKQVVATPIMRDLPENRRRTTHFQIRGNFLQPGEEVSAAVPTAFGSLPEGAARNRLAVAAWLMSSENPLTARVAVNRVWSRLFGRGIVETEEDFGAQGTPPTHPELLDWLAAEYRGSLGWSLKKLCRTIVLSRVYQQSSATTAQAKELDPKNVWLSRAPRFRLPAETVRDQALQAAGLLSDKIGGPSVMPPQPPGIWKATYSKLKWETSDGDDRYRRALYTFWRRTSPYPSMLTFDAGSREVCVIRRVRTNSPLQALVTLNDPVFVEAAGALALRMREEGGDSASQLTAGFRCVLTRSPEESELQKLTALLTETQTAFASDADATKELLTEAGTAENSGDDAAELAALTVVANVLLNLDETLMRQ
jgi:mono/diheme cytochrome c family protein